MSTRDLSQSVETCDCDCADLQLESLIAIPIRTVDPFSLSLLAKIPSNLTCFLVSAAKAVAPFIRRFQTPPTLPSPPFFSKISHIPHSVPNTPRFRLLITVSTLHDPLPPICHRFPHFCVSPPLVFATTPHFYSYFITHASYFVTNLLARPPTSFSFHVVSRQSSTSMARPIALKRPHPPCTPLSHVDPHHRAAFAAALLQIPSAASAMQRARAKRTPIGTSVFILDWDDTCCATSFLEGCGFMADLDTRIDQFAPTLAAHLRLLEIRVLSLLKTAVNLGTVLIVTNAGDGWVELSSSRFLPAVRAFLEDHYKLIKIISARARYVDVYRDHPLQWKALTFADELRSIFASKPQLPHPLHVIVLGDSIGDQYAAHVASNSLVNSGIPIVLKVVKFLERPSIGQLCKELSVLLDHIDAMAAHTTAFDVSMYNETPQVPNNQSHHSHSLPQSHPQQDSMQVDSDVSSTPASTSNMKSTHPAPIPSAPAEPHPSSISPVSHMPTCAAVV